jgi:hypothetical protein
MSRRQKFHPKNVLDLKEAAEMTIQNLTMFPNWTQSQGQSHIFTVLAPWVLAC